MNTTRLTALWRRGGAFLIVLAVFAGGIGAYAASRALWPLLLVWWPWLVAGAVPVVALGAWWLWWRLPRWQAERLRMTVRDVKARTDIEDNFRKTVGQLLGGAAVLIGAAVAYLQFTAQQEASRRQLEVSLKQLDASAKQSEQQRDAAAALLISNQVAKGFEQLAGEKLEMRLGGIYALEGVMNTSERYHKPVLEALSAFVRERTKGKGTPETPLPDPDADIQAVLTVIGRRVVQEAWPDLNNARIPNAGLSGANLTGADLSFAKLTRATLSGANLSDAKLTRATLSGADLSFAKLTRAKLTRAILTGAILTGAILTRGADLSDANLTGAILTRATLTGADLTQVQLDTACGESVKLDPGLTIKPCPKLQ